MADEKLVTQEIREELKKRGLIVETVHAYFHHLIQDLNVRADIEKRLLGCSQEILDYIEQLKTDYEASQKTTRRK